MVFQFPQLSRCVNGVRAHVLSLISRRQRPTPALDFRRTARFASAIVCDGIASSAWVINLSVDPDYVRKDPVEHLYETTSRLGLVGTGIGLMTAVDVTQCTDGRREEEQVAIGDGRYADANHGVSVRR